MKNFFLFLIAISITFSSYIAFASGPLDGIYTCDFFSTGGDNVGQVFITFNSNESTSVITIPNITGVIFQGYFIGGAASDTDFNGTSDRGETFKATATGFIGEKKLFLEGSVYIPPFGSTEGTGECLQVI